MNINGITIAASTISAPVESRPMPRRIVPIRLEFPKSFTYAISDYRNRNRDSVWSLDRLRVVE